MSPEPPTLAWGRAWALLCRHGAASCPAPLGPGLGISAPRSSALCGVRQGEGKQLLAGPCLVVERLRGTKPAGKKGAQLAGLTAAAPGAQRVKGSCRKEPSSPNFPEDSTPPRGFQGVPNASWCSNYAFKWRGGRQIATISCRAPAAFSVAGLGRGAAGAQVPSRDPVHQEQDPPSEPRKAREQHRGSESQLYSKKKTKNKKKEEKNTPEQSIIHFPTPPVGQLSAASC